MPKRRPIIIAYDISSDDVRNKVFRIVKKWRLGGQRSLHECKLTKKDAESLFIQMAEPLAEETDKLMMICIEQHRPILCRGTGQANLGKRIWHIR